MQPMTSSYGNRLPHLWVQQTSVNQGLCVVGDTGPEGRLGAAGERLPQEVGGLRWFLKSEFPLTLSEEGLSGDGGSMNHSGRTLLILFDEPGMHQISL